MINGGSLFSVMKERDLRSANASSTSWRSPLAPEACQLIQAVFEFTSIKIQINLPALQYLIIPSPARLTSANGISFPMNDSR